MSEYTMKHLIAVGVGSAILTGGLVALRYSRVINSLSSAFKKEIEEQARKTSVYKKSLTEIGKRTALKEPNFEGLFQSIVLKNGGEVEWLALGVDEMVDAELGLQPGMRQCYSIDASAVEGMAGRVIVVSTLLGNAVFYKRTVEGVTTVHAMLPENLKPFVGDGPLCPEMFDHWTGGVENKEPNIGHMFNKAFPVVEVTEE